MKCPVCKDVTLLMMNKNGIDIDYCPECRGVWLDRGELEKLIQSEKAYSNSYDDEEYRKDNYRNPTNDKGNYGNNQNYNDDYNSHYNKNKKKRSFFESFDIFD